MYYDHRTQQAASGRIGGGLPNLLMKSERKEVPSASSNSRSANNPHSSSSSSSSNSSNFNNLKWSESKQVWFVYFSIAPLIIVLIVYLGVSLDNTSSVVSSAAAATTTTYSSYDRQGIQVINAIVANIWPSMRLDLLKRMRAHPVPLQSFLLELRSGSGGGLRYPPRIYHIKTLWHNNNNDDDDKSTAQAQTTTTTTTTTSDQVVDIMPAPPPRFECKIEYKGRPQVDFLLKHRGMAGIFFPQRADIPLDIRSMVLYGKLQVELDLRHKKGKNGLCVIYIYIYSVLYVVVLCLDHAR